MHILVIAPRETDLEYVPLEVSELINAHNAISIAYLDNDDQSVFAAIDRITARGETIAGLWYIGHGTRTKVKVGQADLDASAIISHVQTSGAEWVVVNACEAEHVLRIVRMATGVAYLTTAVTGSEAGMIPDVDAWRMSASLARSLIKHNGDLGLAFAEVSPRGAGEYTYKGRLREQMSNEAPKAERSKDVDELYRLVNSLDTRLSILEATINIKLDQLVASMSDTRKDLAGLRAEGEVKEQSILKATRTLTFIGAVFALLLFLTVAAVEIRLLFQ